MRELCKLHSILLYHFSIIEKLLDLVMLGPVLNLFQDCFSISAFKSLIKAKTLDSETSSE